MDNYIFKSERLGFRKWLMSDLDDFTLINSDDEVMKHFPNSLTRKETENFIGRLQKHYKLRGYNYFATEVLTTGELIGFIGLAYQTYNTDFSPGTDIGWRLKKSAWGKGYATEGAKKCLEFAFNDLNIDKVFSTCTKGNIQSENVMKKIGMKRMSEFKHPNLKQYPEYENCIWYEKTKN